MTWEQLNALLVQFEQFANAYMSIFYLIVLAITATVIVNTLIMSVFERTREIGILSAIGMKGRRDHGDVPRRIEPAGGRRVIHGAGAGRS